MDRCLQGGEGVFSHAFRCKEKTKHPPPFKTVQIQFWSAAEFHFHIQRQGINHWKKKKKKIKKIPHLMPPSHYSHVFKKKNRQINYRNNCFINCNHQRNHPNKSPVGFSINNFHLATSADIQSHIKQDISL